MTLPPTQPPKPNAVKRLRGRKGEAQCQEMHCLVRAKAGKKRISTTVPKADADAFRAELGVVRCVCGVFVGVDVLWLYVCY